jgi:hypothetical protein
MDTDRGLSRQQATLISKVGEILWHSKATLHFLPPQIEQGGLSHRKASG